MKRLAKVLCARAVTALPWGGRRAVLDALLDDFGCYAVFTELGQRLSVESVSVRGANGVFRGALDDAGLLGRYALEGSWALETIRALEDVFASNGGTFLDIGANIGLVAIPIARNPAVDCHCFEPEPANFAHLKHNVEASGVKNVSLHETALFDKSGTLSLGLSDENSGDHQLRPDPGSQPDRTLISVPVERLDDAVDHRLLKHPIAAKIDVQGAEAGVFSGGAKVLAEADLICFEFCPKSMRRIGGDFDFQRAHLQSHFRSGAIVPGDTNERSGSMMPISALVDQLSAYWNDSGIGARYFDVVVRK
jgi:FkbM family methyltransferase